MGQGAAQPSKPPSHVVMERVNDSTLKCWDGGRPETRKTLQMVVSFRTKHRGGEDNPGLAVGGARCLGSHWGGSGGGGEGVVAGLG